MPKYEVVVIFHGPTVVVTKEGASIEHIMEALDDLSDDEIMDLGDTYLEREYQYTEISNA